MSNRIIPFEAIANSIATNKEWNRSAWGRGVTEYAAELIEDIKDIDPDMLVNASLVKKALLNGADSWSQYSWGGCSLIYNSDIAERLCTPSELKRTRGGEWRPNRNEEWLDTQARALNQAARRVIAMMRHYGMFA